MGKGLVPPAPIKPHLVTEPRYINLVNDYGRRGSGLYRGAGKHSCPAVFPVRQCVRLTVQSVKHYLEVLVAVHTVVCEFLTIRVAVLNLSACSYIRRGGSLEVVWIQMSFVTWFISLTRKLRSSEKLV
jgi:hypothetical protein